MVKVAIVGCGAIAQKRHAPACSAYKKGVILQGVFDPIRKNAEEFAKKYRTKVFGSLEEMLSDPQIDAVLVCTPEKYHCDTVIACLKAGKHVLCEKPMGMNLKEAKEMTRVWKESGKKLSIAFSQRHYSEYQIASRMIREGAVGRPLMFYSFLTNPGVEYFICGDEKTFYDRQLENVGGVMLNVGCHRVDLIRYLLDCDIKEVMAAVPALDKRYADGSFIHHEDTAMVLMRLEDGIHGMLFTSWCNYGEADVETKILGTQGTLRINAKSEIVLEKRDGFQMNVSMEKTEKEKAGYDVVWDFLDAVISGQPVLADAVDGLKCMEVMDAIQRSGKTGAWEKVNCKWDTMADK